MYNYYSVIIIYNLAYYYADYYVCCANTHA